MDDHARARRRLLLASGPLCAAGLALNACSRTQEVTANEDLMREHGIIRRALFVYAEAARRAQHQPTTLPLASLLDTVKLFREFAEDYHERALEEAHIFPVVRKVAGPAAQLVDVLLAQHKRGREITDYIGRIAVTGRLAASETDRFVAAVTGLVEMYGPHAAREDTVLFPAWKAALGEAAYKEMGEQFEDLEEQIVGRDGFGHALDRIAKIEVAFGLHDLQVVTAPPLPPA